MLTPAVERQIVPNEHRSREEWVRDIDSRQRNIVFPDTVDNEGRFWRNVVSGKRKLTAVQTVGIAIVYLTVIAAFASVLAIELSTDRSYDSILRRIVGQFGGYIIAFILLGCFFLLLKFSTRRRPK